MSYFAHLVCLYWAKMCKIYVGFLVQNCLSYFPARLNYFDIIHHMNNPAIVHGILTARLQMSLLFCAQHFAWPMAWHNNIVTLTVSPSFYQATVQARLFAHFWINNNAGKMHCSWNRGMLRKMKWIIFAQNVDLIFIKANIGWIGAGLCLIQWNTNGNTYFPLN